jgi:hypothetical protein
LWVDEVPIYENTSLPWNAEGALLDIFHFSIGNTLTHAGDWQAGWEYMEFDDLIISTTYHGPDITLPYVDTFSPPNGATGVPVSTTSASFHIKDLAGVVDESTISVNGPNGMKTCSTGLTCAPGGDSADITVTYGGLSLDYYTEVPFYITATDDSFNTLSNYLYSFTVEADPGPSLTITTTSLPDGVVGTPYSQTLVATGGAEPYSWGSAQYYPNAPYPPSTTVFGIEWDFAGKVQTGQGSDLWETAWGGDNNTYTVWGDGGGPDGTNTVCRTNFGMDQLVGSPPNYTFTEIWGCMADDTGCAPGATHDASCDAPYGGVEATYGVPDALIAIDNTLYVSVVKWATDGYRIYKSTDYGQSWDNTNQVWPVGAGLFMPETFVKHGAGDANGDATYVYVIGRKQEDEGNVYMARGPKATFDNAATWEYFTGTPSSPTWGTWGSATVIFSDPNSQWPVGKIQYFPVIDRYIYTNNRTEIQTLSVYESENPWGPWFTIAYYDDWGGYDTTTGWWYVIIPSSISGDDSEFYMLFSGASSPTNWDNYNLIKGTFTLGVDVQLPPGLTLSSGGVISGTPTTAGTTGFTAEVVDSDTPPATDNQALSITILPFVPVGQVTVDLTGVEDTYAGPGAPTTNFSTIEATRIYTWPTSAVANMTYEDWDLSSIPDNVTINQATLKHYHYDFDGSGGDDPYNITVHKISNVTPVISNLNWNTYDGSNPWTGGADGGVGDLAAAESTSGVTTTFGWFTWDVTNMAQDAYTASTHLFLVIKPPLFATSDSNRYFAAIDHAASAWRPILTITYTPGEGGGPPPPTTLAPGKMRINVGGGNFNTFR